MRRQACAAVAALAVAAAALAPGAGAATLTDKQVRDSVRGAWTGGIAGAAWGFPVEFDYVGRVVPRREVPRYSVAYANRYTFSHPYGPDETYMEIPFLDPLSRDPYAGWPEWGAALAATRFRLFSANLRARRNLAAGLAAPASGDPDNNPFAYNIDFQIEADFAGLVAPAQPGAAIDIAWRAGHVMNYGDGVYGGVMVAAMTAEAFRARKLSQIIQAGRLAVPEGSSYREMIEDVISWHRANPGSWRRTWRLLERKWNAHKPAAKRDPRHVEHEFNIDAKLNGAYILLGLLYGKGRYARSVGISLRAGQDTDCNPANVGSIIGAWRGFRRLPKRFVGGLRYGREISGTGYTIGEAIDATLHTAGRITVARGGAAAPAGWTIPDSPVVAPLLEQWPISPDPAPQLQASASLAGRTVSFDASAQDPDGIGGYWWSFGDLSSAPGPSPVHTYRAPGTYRATVWASDGLGRTSARVVDVAVPGP
jgi:ADP-ribosylglycohydrolase/PKD domain